MHKFNMRMEGRTVKVLFEQEFDSLSEKMEGLTMNFSRVIAIGKSDIKGKILDVKLAEAKEDYILGNVLYD